MTKASEIVTSPGPGCMNFDKGTLSKNFKAIQALLEVTPDETLKLVYKEYIDDILETLPELSQFEPIDGDTFTPGAEEGILVEVQMTANKTIFIDFPEDFPKPPIAVSVHRTGGDTLIINGQVFFVKQEYLLIAYVYTFGEYRPFSDTSIEALKPQILLGQENIGVIPDEPIVSEVQFSGADVVKLYETTSPRKLIAEGSAWAKAKASINDFGAYEYEAKNDFGTTTIPFIVRVGNPYKPIISGLVETYTFQKGQTPTGIIANVSALPSASSGYYNADTDALIQSGLSFTTPLFADTNIQFRSVNYYKEEGSDVSTAHISTFDLLYIAEGIAQDAPTYTVASDFDLTDEIAITNIPAGKTIADMKLAVNGTDYVAATQGSSLNKLKLPDTEIAANTAKIKFNGTNVLNDSPATTITQVFTGSIIAPPTNLVFNPETGNVTFTKNPLYPNNSDYEYSVASGSPVYTTYPDVVFSVSIYDFITGQFKLRTKAANGKAASVPLTNAAPWTHLPDADALDVFAKTGINDTDFQNGTDELIRLIKQKSNIWNRIKYLGRMGDNFNQSKFNFKDRNDIATLVGTDGTFNNGFRANNGNAEDGDGILLSWKPSLFPNGVTMMVSELAHIEGAGSLFGTKPDAYVKYTLNNTTGGIYSANNNSRTVSRQSLISDHYEVRHWASASLSKTDFYINKTLLGTANGDATPNDVLDKNFMIGNGGFFGPTQSTVGVLLLLDGYLTTQEQSDLDDLIYQYHLATGYTQEANPVIGLV